MPDSVAYRVAWCCGANAGILRHFHRDPLCASWLRHSYPPTEVSYIKAQIPKNLTHHTLRTSTAHYKSNPLFHRILKSSQAIMSGQSNVGNSQVYEAGDQRNYKDSEIKQAQEEARFHEGKQNSHLAQDSSKPFFHNCTFPATGLTHAQRTSAPSPTSSSARRSARTRMTTS